ncbi:MAG: 2-oxoacid:acceptor oxidoreductase subunit alpha [Proteobacteria bacterium]|nr:2-oxoacid:acceptor oxidoreductase subunit alpha [Pseudomonadota bacterium]
MQETLHLTIKIAGDSGDGIQLTGSRLAMINALFGNNVATYADFPAEIRAPKGSLFGVSAYQLQVGSQEIFTPGDAPDLLVAFNPAALEVCFHQLKEGAMIIVDEDAFVAKNLEKIGLKDDPLESSQLSSYTVVKVAITTSLEKLFSDSEYTKKEIHRCKNFFALGMLCWLLNRSIEDTSQWMETKFRENPALAKANIKALNEGYTQAFVRELLPLPYQIHPATSCYDPNTQYRFITGNTGIALGLLSAAETSQKQLFFATYPITPASTIINDLVASPYPHLMAFQAEDEMAAIGSAIGAAYGGNLGVVATSGPGFILMSEFINLAVMSELPCVVINVQRAGPSTGMPTKTEQSDLLAALYGRNGESAVVVLAPHTPVHCFSVTALACKIAIERNCVVILLSDAYLAGGHQIWQIPEISSLPTICPAKLPDSKDYAPYNRDPNTLARYLAPAGTKGYTHRIGGLEKKDGTGEISYDGNNHQRMIALRDQKIQKVIDLLPPLEVEGASSAETLIISWGSTYGPLKRFVKKHLTACQKHERLAHLQLLSLNPWQKELAGILSNYTNIIVIEHNRSQACKLLIHSFPQYTFLSLTKYDGRPWRQGELREGITKLMQTSTTHNT